MNNITVQARLEWVEMSGNIAAEPRPWPTNSNWELRLDLLNPQPSTPLSPLISPSCNHILVFEFLANIVRRSDIYRNFLEHGNGNVGVSKTPQCICLIGFLFQVQTIYAKGTISPNKIPLEISVSQLGMQK